MAAPACIKVHEDVLVGMRDVFVDVVGGEFYDSSRGGDGQRQKNEDLRKEYLALLRLESNLQHKQKNAPFKGSRSPSHNLSIDQ